jgi:hypothetical protein
VEAKTGCPAPLAEATLPRLAATDLPKNFAECIAVVGADPHTPRRCRFAAKLGSPLYHQCLQIGGVESRACGIDGGCGVDYSCGWRPCLGSLCE